MRTFHNQLMRTSNKRQPIVVVKSLRYILPECVSSTSGRDTPSATVVGIRPEKITHRSFMRDFLHPVNRSNMVEGIDGRRKTAM